MFSVINVPQQHTELNSVIFLLSGEWKKRGKEKKNQCPMSVAGEVITCLVFRRFKVNSERG